MCNTHFTSSVALETDCKWALPKSKGCHKLWALPVPWHVFFPTSWHANSTWNNQREQMFIAKENQDLQALVFNNPAFLTPPPPLSLTVYNPFTKAVWANKKPADRLNYDAEAISHMWPPPPCCTGRWMNHQTSKTMHLSTVHLPSTNVNILSLFLLAICKVQIDYMLPQWKCLTWMKETCVEHTP